MFVSRVKKEIPFIFNFQQVLLLKKLYEHPDDVDFIVGGNLERHSIGSLAGPTFKCIWLKQFTNIMTSDRFFYNVKGGPFNTEQLKEIRKATSARWICANSNVKMIQKEACKPVTLL